MNSLSKLFIGTCIVKDFRNLMAQPFLEDIVKSPICSMEVLQSEMWCLGDGLGIASSNL